MDENQAAAAFAALSQETRVRLLRLLVETGATGMRAGEVQSRLGIPASTLSFHLSALTDAGLVQSTRQGRTMIYAVRMMGLRDLLVFLTETCCYGSPEMCGDIARLIPDDEDEGTSLVPAFNVLFVCTRNAARSIMAEAVLAKTGKRRFHAYSAGSEPALAPNPEVIANLERAGHDVARLRCKSWNEFTGPDAPRMDFVIALCDTTEGQACPEFGDEAITASWPLPDPAKFVGTAVERGVLLNQLYAMLSRRIELFRSLPFGSLDRMALKARLDEIGMSSLARA